MATGRLPRHLLVTNDFPPKRGGIQSYLWELWRRLPPEGVTVLTTAHTDTAGFDAAQAFRIERVRSPVLLPTPRLVRRIDALAAEVDASLVVLDPALPLGLVGPHLARPYAVVLHGAEVTVPGRLPGLRAALTRVLGGADRIVSAGSYPAAEAQRAMRSELPPVHVVAPGVDIDRFRPLDAAARQQARIRLGLGGPGPLIVTLSRLVPRKGMDVVIKAVARLAPRHPALVLAVVGTGRDRGRLERLATQSGVAGSIRFLGSVADHDLPAVYGAADIFAMVCRDRWAGLEQEGFGIVFLEAAACGVVQVAGASGGVGEAVAHGRTGLLVSRPGDVGRAAGALACLLDDLDRREAMGAAARERVVAEFSYDALAVRLAEALRP